MTPAHRLILAAALRRPDLAPPLPSSASDTGALAAAVAGTARHHMVSGLVHAALQAHIPAAEVDRRFPGLTADATAATRRNLLLAATLHQMQGDHLKPLGIDWLTFKGIALAQRYCGGLGQRSCRDIDLLIEPRAMEPLLMSLLGAGFRPIDEYLPPRGGALTEPGYVRTLARLVPDVGLLSPQGILVEVHSRIDLAADAFPVRSLLRRAEAVPIAGGSVPAPATDDLFPYICYHHSRHLWSRMHWLADLTAIRTHPSFDADRVRHRAREQGVLRLVETCLGLPDEVARQMQADTVMPAQDLRGELAGYCLRFVDEGVAPPEEGRMTETEDLRARWLGRRERVSLDIRLRDRATPRLRLLARRLRPSWQEHLRCPLPPALHWLYWIWRPLRLTGETLPALAARLRAAAFVDRKG